MQKELWHRLEYPCLPHWLWVAPWDELVRVAKARGVKDAENWDVRMAYELIIKAGLLEDFEVAADLLDHDPRTGKELKESRWFISLR